MRIKFPVYAFVDILEELYRGGVDEIIVLKEDSELSISFTGTIQKRDIEAAQNKECQDTRILPRPVRLPQTKQ